jgi:hypothetical protein
VDPQPAWLSLPPRSHPSTDRIDRTGTKIVYASEDQILLFLARHLLQLDNTSIEPGDALAQRDAYVRCGPYTWQPQVDGRVVADEWPPHIAPVTADRRFDLTAVLPRSGDGGAVFVAAGVPAYSALQVVQETRALGSRGTPSPCR